MFRYSLLAILLASACKFQAPVPPPASIAADSIVAVMQQATKNKIKAFQFEQVRLYLDSLRPHLPEHPGVQSTWWRLRGLTFIIDTRTDSSRICLQRALRLAYQIDTLNNYVLWAKKDMGMQYLMRQQYDSAFKYSFEAYYQKDRVEDPRFTMAVAGQLSETFLFTGDMDNCRRFLLEAYDHATAPDEKSLVANNIAAYYDRVGKSDSVDIYMAEAQLFKSQSDHSGHANDVGNQGAVLLKAGKPDEALPFLLESLALSRRFKLLTPDHYNIVAAAYADQKRYGISRVYLDSAIALATDKKDFENLDIAYVHLANNLMEQGIYRDAFNAVDSARKYHNVQDSVSFAEKAREIETQYKVKDMDQRIASLTLANALSQQISRQRLVILISVIAGSLLLLAVMFLLARRRQVSLQLQQTNLLQRLLRSQMDSHFIFNMLSVLQGFVLGGLLDRAAAYLNRCAKLLQVSLVNARENYVLLQDEVTALESYLDMQQLQLGERFAYAVEVYEGYQDDMLLVPPMLIQPFVENSVIHGVRNLTDRSGMVRLSIVKDEHALHCTIEDNGLGLREGEKAGKPSLAMEITRDRLEVLGRQTGRKAGFTIRNKTEMEGPGVIVEITIPYRLG